MSDSPKVGDEYILTTLTGKEFIDVVKSVSPEGVVRLRDTYGSEAWARIDSIRRAGGLARTIPELNLTESRGTA